MAQHVDERACGLIRDVAAIHDDLADTRREERRHELGPRGGRCEDRLADTLRREERHEREGGEEAVDDLFILRHRGQVAGRDVGDGEADMDFRRAMVGEVVSKPLPLGLLELCVGRRRDVSQRAVHRIIHLHVAVIPPVEGGHEELPERVRGE